MTVMFYSKYDFCDLSLQIQNRLNFDNHVTKYFVDYLLIFIKLKMYFKWFLLCCGLLSSSARPGALFFF